MYLNGKVSRVPGIPIATDIEKGVYYVSRDGAVMLASPDGTALRRGGRQDLHRLRGRRGFRG